MSMTRQEVFKALADRQLVQVLNTEGKWHAPILVPLEGLWDEAEWRIKPEPIPPGDLTYEEAVELCKQGVKLERYSKIDKCWEPSAANGCVVSALAEGTAYRRKPTPKLVPLGPEDVPPGSVIKGKTWPRCEWMMVCDVQKCGFATLRRDKSANMWTWEFAMKNGEISRDGGKSWEPCSKEESQ